MDFVAIKQKAKSDIAGKIGILFLITLVISVISGGISALVACIPLGSVIVAVVVTPAFALSLVSVYIGVARGKDPLLEDAFGGFQNFFAAFKVQFFVGLFTFLWSLLFIIPGIIKSISYSMSMYVLSEDPTKPAFDCIDESVEMMQGKKMDYFLLILSFIGWALLSVLTLGIVGIWAIPYMEATKANFYLQNKKEAPQEPSGLSVPPTVTASDVPAADAASAGEGVSDVPAADAASAEEGLSDVPVADAASVDGAPKDGEGKPEIGSDEYWNTIL